MSHWNHLRDLFLISDVKLMYPFNVMIIDHSSSLFNFFIKSSVIGMSVFVEEVLLVTEILISIVCLFLTSF